MSTLFLRTLREDPSDAEVASHRLLLRAGYIRRAAPGGFTWLPLGWAVYQNVERIIREEMVAEGFQEVHFPALLPREPYEITGRWTDYGDGVFRVRDRKGADFMLAPTHEEMFTLLVKDLYSSYKDLPLRLFQIQTKYRDEARPRAGLLRGREFVMKDSYSFDLDESGFKVSYDKHRQAYQRTFDRLGVPYVIVAAMSGAMGGSASEEFLVPMEVGEDTFVRCSNCDYAANTEAVRVPVPPALDLAEAPPARVVETPDTPTIQTLVDLLNTRADLARADRQWTAADTLKNVVLKLRHPDRTVELLAIGLPGDREVDMKRLEAQVAPAETEPFTEEDFAANPLLVRGYIGPQALGADKPAGVRYLVDPRVVTGTPWVTGSNIAGHHVVHLTAGRDFTSDGTIEAAEVRGGDPCPVCGSPLEIARGMELGHIFQLGTKYSAALGLNVLDQNGKQRVVTMGSYGFGVSRAVGAIAELNCDDKGLIWPREVAPADVHIVATGKATDPQLAAAEQLAAACAAVGLRVLLDDRVGVSPGIKFNDAELVGVPTIVIVGRGLADGLVELKDRRTGERQDVALDDIVARLSDPT